MAEKKQRTTIQRAVAGAIRTNVQKGKKRTKLESFLERIPVALLGQLVKFMTLDDFKSARTTSSLVKTDLYMVRGQFDSIVLGQDDVDAWFTPDDLKNGSLNKLLDVAAIRSITAKNIHLDSMFWHEMSTTWTQACPKWTTFIIDMPLGKELDEGVKIERFPALTTLQVSWARELQPLLWPEIIGRRTLSRIRLNRSNWRSLRAPLWKALESDQKWAGRLEELAIPAILDLSHWQQLVTWCPRLTTIAINGDSSSLANIGNTDNDDDPTPSVPFSAGDVFGLLAKHLPNLVDFSWSIRILSKMHEGMLQTKEPRLAALAPLSSLRRLELDINFFLLTSEEVAAAVRNWPNLRSLTLHGGMDNLTLDLIEALPPNMEHLDLERVRKIKRTRTEFIKLLTTFLARQKRLAQIPVDMRGWISFLDGKQVVDIFTDPERERIQRLELFYANKLSSEDVRRLLATARLQNFGHLRVECQRLEPACIPDESTFRLSRLELSAGSMTEGKQVLSRLAQCHPDVNELNLNISGDMDLTLADLAAYTEACPRLRMLDIHGKIRRVQDDKSDLNRIKQIKKQRGGQVRIERVYKSSNWNAFG